MTTKKCSRCKSRKSIKQFYKDKSAKTGFRSECKPCGKK